MAQAMVMGNDFCKHQLAKNYRTRANNRLLRAGRSSADRYCQVDVDPRPSRPPFPRTAVWHRPSGFRRCGRSGGRRPAAGVAECRPAAASGWTDRALRVQLQPSNTACQYSGGISSPGPGVRVGGTFPRAAAVAASCSICFRVGMRQLAGRSVMSRLEHNKNKCRVR
jgi:hypothetical protein